jgi:inhibitor of Bruton tyrosine kinase
MYCRVDMKAILAEAEEMQASSASGRPQHPHPASSSLTPVHRQRSGDGIRVSFSLPKTHDVPPHSSTLDSMRSTSSPAWRVQNPSLLSAEEPPGSSPGRSSAMSTTRITPPGSMQASSEKPSPSQPFSAPAMQKSKSWSNQSSPGPGPSHPRRLPGLGPVISPSKAKVKAKAGQTVTTHASSYVPPPKNTARFIIHKHSNSGGNVWTSPLGVQPVSRAPSSVPISFAEIQQLQSQPDNAAAMAKERRSLRDIQAEEAELQTEAEFMKWWTAEEERIRLENEAIAASLLEPQKPQPQPQQRHLGRKKKKSAATAEGESAPGPTTLRGGDRKR